MDNNIDYNYDYYKDIDNKTVGDLIRESRERAGLSKNQLGEMAKVSHTEIARIESGEREIPNPKTLRKISKHLDVNYNVLMYAAGLGFQVTTLNPFLIDYYEGLKGEKINEALYNTQASIDNWTELINSFQNRLDTEDISETERDVIEQTIEDTKYQIKTAKEIVRVLVSAGKKERFLLNEKEK